MCKMKLNSVVTGLSSFAYLTLFESINATNYLRSNAGIIKDEIDQRAIVSEDFEAWERELFNSHSYTSSSRSKKTKSNKNKHHHESNSSKKENKGYRKNSSSSESKIIIDKFPDYNNVDNYLPFLSFFDDDKLVDLDFFVDLDGGKDVRNKDNKFDVKLKVEVGP